MKLIKVLQQMDSLMKETKTADAVSYPFVEESDQGKHRKLEYLVFEIKRLIRDGPRNGESSVLVKNDKYDLKHGEGVKDDVLDLVMDAKLHLEEEQRLLEELRKHLDDITELKNGVIDNDYSSRLLKFGGMTSGALKIVGIERRELLVKTGTESEGRIDPCQLASVLANELELLSQQDSDNSLETTVLHREMEKCGIHRRTNRI